MKVLGVALWGMLLYGTLRLADLPTATWDHSICGPWGCGPPLSALLACHGFWIVLMAPVVVWAIRSWSRPTLWRVGTALLAGGSLGLAAIAVDDTTHWLPAVSVAQRAYLPQRFLFRVATLVDAPLVELLLAGALLLLAARGRSRPSSLQDDRSPDNHVEPFRDNNV
ncbi:hypothetical protein Pan216_56750 [Planctomycetes bacterium Pan216]|uniref:DUF3995 domain-containing protein n=1 Tax=Kolteria novifilia TaxID=2527975 RepID=A0A518BD09_9BACT|nr:hypothetical protein Pan216_56750 [Planctomycetes bacterium Pan216]